MEWKGIYMRMDSGGLPLHISVQGGKKRHLGREGDGDKAV